MQSIGDESDVFGSSVADAFQDVFGEAAIPAPNIAPLPSKVSSPEVARTYQERITTLLKDCHTRRDVQEIEVDTLAECMLISSEIYKENPTSDNAYQLAALTSAHKISLSQLEKMIDPQKQLENTEELIRGMFVDVVKAMILQMDRIKQDFVGRYPAERTTITDMFTRMVSSIQPEAQNIYNGFHDKLKKSQGFK